jgi:co-chaperonin GroES (HSP10)
MSNNQIQDFLDILDTTDKKLLKVDISSKKTINISPLSFKQQKRLVTTGLDGLAGAMSFIKTLNEIIIENSSEEDLKIYDRLPIVLALRKELSSKKIEKDEIEVDIGDLIKQFKKFNSEETVTIDEKDYQIILRIPTLKQENKLLSICIEDMKKIDSDNISKNISLILSYEIPKFMESITFGDKAINMDGLSISDRTKIMDNLPANVTNKITEFILKVREYDENLLTFNGVTIDIDSSFFE